VATNGAIPMPADHDGPNIRNLCGRRKDSRTAQANAAGRATRAATREADLAAAIAESDAADDASEDADADVDPDELVPPQAGNYFPAPGMGFDDMSGMPILDPVPGLPISPDGLAASLATPMPGPNYTVAPVVAPANAIPPDGPVAYGDYMNGHQEEEDYQDGPMNGMVFNQSPSSNGAGSGLQQLPNDAEYWMDAMSSRDARDQGEATYQWEGAYEESHEEFGHDSQSSGFVFSSPPSQFR
jgi:hypothetical protein